MNYTRYATREEQCWHLWFAWYPIHVGSSWVWWKTVARRKVWRPGLIRPYYEVQYANA